jgi:serine/threonine-protein kinase
LAARADGSPLIKVLDFGISKATMPGERGITATEAVLGSPGYMSPEQIRSAKYVDQRADVWGVGVCLYELLTGQPPFDGSSVAAVSVQIVLETPKLVHELRPGVPEELSRVVQRCLEKEPAKRYANMGELAAALLPFAPSTAAPLADSIRRIARGSVPFAATVAASAPDLQSAVAGGTDGNWERTKPRPQRGRTLMLAMAGLGLVVALLASVFALGRRSVDRATPAASEAAQQVPASGAQQLPAQAEPRTEASAVSGAPPSPSTLAPDVAAPAGSSRRTRLGSAPRGPVCPKGQVLSAGHCCPSGLVWQKTACDRPLAVSLP